MSAMVRKGGVWKRGQVSGASHVDRQRRVRPWITPNKPKVAPRPAPVLVTFKCICPAERCQADTHDVADGI